MISFERAMVVSCRLSIVITVLSLTFSSNLPSNVCDAQINRGCHFGAKFGEEGVD